MSWNIRFISAFGQFATSVPSKQALLSHHLGIWYFNDNFDRKQWLPIQCQKRSSESPVTRLAWNGLMESGEHCGTAKGCIFLAEKGIFSKSSFYTKMFSDAKYSLSACQKIILCSNPKLIFFTKFNLSMMHALFVRYQLIT